MNRQNDHDVESYELDDATRSRRSDEFAYSSFDDDGTRAGLLTEQPTVLKPRYLSLGHLIQLIPFLRHSSRALKHGSKSRKRRICLRPSVSRRLVVISFAFLTAIALLESIFFPSYTIPPPHYIDLRSKAQGTDVPGRANPGQEKIYIAASIFDKGGHLVNGAWGESVLGLVDVLGPDNVYLSIYENDAGADAEAALSNFKQKVKCKHTIQFDKHLSFDDVPSITLPDGSKRTKRIAYLSEVRNRALKPLEESRIRYDKLLYINDVVFDPIDAAQLLFSTHANAEGKSVYRAACAVDFINPVKYYDTFATRDLEGYGIGLPFFPWFTSAGSGISRKDVLAGTDAVRVRSCWGGMVAFDARYFQQASSLANVPPTAGSESPSNMTVPYVFRAENDLYWDASECCLIHADIQHPDPGKSGIYMNPFVRVAYDKRTLSWLAFARRFERLYSPIHYLVSKVVGMPWYNPRQNERAWEMVEEKVWVSDPELRGGGSFQMVERVATHSGFCGRRALQVMKTDITSGGKNWEFLPIPG